MPAGGYSRTEELQLFGLIGTVPYPDNQIFIPRIIG